MKSLPPTKILIRFFVIALIIAAIPVGVFLLNERMSPRRDVASNIGVEGGLTSIADQKAVKYKILATAKKENSPQGAHLHLGLPMLVADDGRDVFICEEFPTVDWVLTADGVAVAGELPQIVVRAPCVVDAQTHQILGPPISFKEILKLEPLGNSSLEVDWREASESVQIFVRNNASFWPQEWAWTGLRFYGKDKQKSIAIDGYEIISVLGQPLYISTSE